MMCALFTPCAMDFTQHSTFGIMPPAMTPSPTRSLDSFIVSSRMSVPGSSLSVHTPGTSVIRMSFAAPMDAAISPAAVSALTLSACPLSSIATVATTGMWPLDTSCESTAVSTEVTSPTKPNSGFLILPRRVLPSLPHMPTARPPAQLMRDTNDLFTLPTRTISTISIVAASVTRRPLRNLGSMPTFLSQPLISGPPPCTRMGLMPTVERRTRSLMTRSLRDSSVIAAPPYLTTTVCPANRCRYGSASASTETR
mmetsp:Transcript_7377/g.29091  ORF Transcript_7377/g.29091 Transcript_7377/m.29091 type:complete len:254 (-) Transcript_7377:233-994(-)